MLSLLLEHYLSKIVRYEEIIEQIKEIKQEYVFMKVCKLFFNIILIEIICFLFINIAFIFFGFYYLVIFCKIYNKSQISLLTTFLITFVEGLVTNIIIVIIITSTRKFGIKFNNKYIYNSSKYIEKYF